MQKRNSYPHSVVVLGFDYTGLATARCLVEAGVDVYGVSLEKRDIGRWSRTCKVVKLDAGAGLVDRLCDFFRSLPSTPVVIPSSDSLALLLATNMEQMSRYALFSSCSAMQLEEIIFKNGLYRLAQAAGVNTPAQLNPRSEDQIADWSHRYPPPYLLKPYFQNIENCPVETKNEKIFSRKMLLSLVRSKGFDNLVIQQLRMGGDGNIYDCYGVCDSRGAPIRLASHKRIRQYKKDFGATCYGEIPGFKDADMQERIFTATRKLLQSCKFHGVFGIEWLHDIERDEFLLIDFNARPFSSIGHLSDCGLNLPLVAYLDLAQYPLEQANIEPTLEHKYWIHFSRDCRTLPYRLMEGSLSVGEWLISVFKARSYALWSITDPLPAARELAVLLMASVRHTISGIYRWVFVSRDVK